MHDDVYKFRIEQVRDSIAASDLDGFLVIHPSNQRYLTGFTGSSSWLYVTPLLVQLFVDGRYVEQAARECPHVTPVRIGSNSKVKAQLQVCPIELIWAIKESMPGKERSKRNIGFEPHAIVFQIYQELSKHLRGITLVPAQKIVEKFRMVKTQEEIDIITSALRIAEKGLNHIVSYLVPGKRELDVSAEFQYKIKLLGAEKEAFDTIIASGERSSLPHGRASSRTILSGDVVIVDLGAKYEGYYSDLTRTFAVSPKSIKGEELYKILREAQEAAFSKIAPGVKCKDVDLAARRVIEAAGYGSYFSHSLGHGIGLEIHEAPKINQHNDMVLEAGMVFTVEPGIYLPGVLGVRIEDMVLVTHSGYEILTRACKQLSL